MKKIILVLLFFPLISFSQKYSFKIFLDEKGKQTDSTNYDGYKVYNKDYSNTEVDVYHYTKEGDLISQSHWADAEKEYRNGYQKSQFKDGSISHLTEYGENGKTAFTIYYADGKLKRK